MVNTTADTPNGRGTGDDMATSHPRNTSYGSGANGPGSMIEKTHDGPSAGHPNDAAVTPKSPPLAESLGVKRKRAEEENGQTMDVQPSRLEESTDNGGGETKKPKMQSSPDANGGQDHAPHVEDAIAGLFMMTKTPPKEKIESATAEGNSASKEAQPKVNVTSDDAAAGLMMMTQTSTPPSQSPMAAPATGAAYMPPPYHPYPAPYYPSHHPAQYAMAQQHYAAYHAMANANADAATKPAAVAVVSAPAKVAATSPPASEGKQSPTNSDLLPGKKGKFTCQEESTWAMRFRQAQEFKKTHGHCRIPYQYPPNKDLARWAKRQKYQYKLYIGEAEAFEKRSSLTKARIEALERLGFCWDAQQESWNEQFDALVEYVRTHGHAKVAKRERSLGRWVCSQRTRVSQGKMTLERFIGLEAVGFVWASQTPTQNFIVQIEKMREKALQKLQSDPVARQQFAELQAKVSRDPSMLQAQRKIDNIEKISWGNVLAESGLAPEEHPLTSAATTPTIKPHGNSTASSPTSTLAPSSSTHPAANGTNPSLEAAPGTSSSSKTGDAAVEDARAGNAMIETSQKATQKSTAPVAAVNGTEERSPYVASSMKIAATEMEDMAKKTDLISKDALRAKAAALRAAAEEIEMMANNAEASSAADAKFAQV